MISKVLLTTVGLFLAIAASPAQAEVCVFHELQRLTEPDGAGEDSFGHCVSLSNDWAVVGANRQDDMQGHLGSVYVFRRDDNGTPQDPNDDFWQSQGTLNPADPGVDDSFGSSVSLAGDRVVVGAYHDDHVGYASGAAYVYRREDNGTPSDPSDDVWIREAKLTASDPTALSFFGFSVAISGERALVGAPEDDGAGYSAGAAYVFRRDDGGTPSDPSDDVWVQEAKLSASDAGAGDAFGLSVSINGDLAVVGAYGDDDACPGIPFCISGSAYAFGLNDNDTPSDPSDDFWVEEAKLRASDAVRGHFFGMSVSISGNRAVVGAVGDAAGGSHSGSAYVYRRDVIEKASDRRYSVWVQEAKLTASDAAASDLLGFSVSISGDRVMVGAPKDDDAGGESGSAYVYRRDDNGTPSDPDDDQWFQQIKLAASDAAVGARFGASVSIIGRVGLDPPYYLAAIGSAPNETEAEPGSAYVFSLSHRCVRLADYAGFQNCFSGAGGGVLAGCEDLNSDGDNDIDLDDFAALMGS